MATITTLPAEGSILTTPGTFRDVRVEHELAACARCQVTTLHAVGVDVALPWMVGGGSLCIGCGLATGAFQ